MASLRFNKKIYSAGAVQQAAQAFADVARVSHKARGSYLEVELTPLAEAGAPESLEGEFANYVLYATIVDRRS